MSDFTVFIPLTKVDEEKREVWGTATQEVEDSAKEIMDYESSKPFFQSWSDAASKRSGGKSRGNLREMHQPKAAGLLLAMQPDDPQKRIMIGTKVVDDEAWKKVCAGVYTGFSVGGRYVRRWPDMQLRGVTRFTADPQEISLVDAPAVPTATFEMVKMDGSVSSVPFIAKSESEGESAAIEIEDFDPEWASKLSAALTQFSADVAQLVELRKVEADAKEKILSELRQRGSSVGISRRDGEPLTPPQDYPSDWRSYGDPANWGWPCDTDGRCHSALSYYNGGAGKDKYNPREWSILGRRIARMVSSKLGASYRFDPQTKRIERTEQKMADTTSLTKGDYGALLSDLKGQLGQAMEAIGTDPDNAKNMLTQALAAIDVAGDAPAANPNADNPKPPVTQAQVTLAAEPAAPPPPPAQEKSPTDYAAADITKRFDAIEATLKTLADSLTKLSTTPVPVQQTQAPLADLNARVVTPPPEEPEPIKILKAGGPNAFAKAVAAAGSEMALQEMVTHEVVGSLQKGGVATAMKFKVLGGFSPE